MPYMNDLETMAKVVSPVDAAVQSGIQNAQSNQEQDIKNQIAQQTMPAEIAKPGLANQFTQAQTGVEQSIGMGNNIKNLESYKEMPGEIGAVNASNQLKMTQDQAQGLSTIGQIAGQLASVMDGVPPPARPAAMQQFLQTHHIDPAQLGPLASGDPDMLRQVSQKMIQTSSDYLTKQMTEEKHNEGSLAVAKEEGQSRENVAAKITAGREAVANTNAEVKRQLAPLQAVIGQLTAKAANGTATPQELAILKWAQQSQQLIRSGDPFQAGITGTNVNSNVPNVPNVPGAPAPTTTPTTTAATAPDQNAIEAEMRRRGLLK